MIGIEQRIMREQKIPSQRGGDCGRALVAVRQTAPMLEVEAHKAAVIVFHLRHLQRHRQLHQDLLRMVGALRHPGRRPQLLSWRERKSPAGLKHPQGKVGRDLILPVAMPRKFATAHGKLLEILLRGGHSSGLQRTRLAPEPLLTAGDRQGLMRGLEASIRETVSLLGLQALHRRRQVPGLLQT